MTPPNPTPNPPPPEGNTPGTPPPPGREDARIDPLRKPLRKAIRTALKRSTDKLDALQNELDACTRAAEWLECGEILKAHLNQLQRGMELVELPDLYHPGHTRIIELQPRLKPLDNAKAYFKKHRKLTRGEDPIRQQIAKEQTRHARLETLAHTLRQWEDEAQPETPIPDPIREEADACRIHIPGLTTRPAPPSDKKNTATGIRTFISRDNLTIYVGKGARENDHLSRHIARGNDWWFHVAHMQGSHVVVVNPHGGKKDPRALEGLPQETLLDAAHLALWFSKARRATRAEIHYTQAKHLRKARHAPPGQVTVLQGNVLTLRVEPTRLDRLLRGDET